MQEKNRNTLLRAIRDLPSHLPAQDFWEGLSQQLDQDQAEQPLRQAIRELPDHYPPAELWENLSVSLDQDQSEKVLQRAIEELPEYEPPDLVWEAVNDSLDKEAKGKSSSVRRIIPMWRRPMIAAGITALICAMAWWTLAPNDGENVSITFATVEVSENIVDEEILRDVQAFELVIDEFNQQLALTADPAMEDLKEELQELEAAKSELEMVMDRYGNDADLVVQITNIEHERTNVLKAMASKI